MPYVDDNGQVCECPRCKRLDVLLDEKDLIIEELQKDIRRWAVRAGKLRREAEGDGWKHHPNYNDALIAFKEWKRQCNHPRSAFTADRFWLIQPFLEIEQYGLKVILMAIKGAAYDPWTTKRKNGTIKVHDGWEQIFKNAGTIEEFACRVPTAELKAVA